MKTAKKTLRIAALVIAMAPIGSAAAQAAKAAELRTGAAKAGEVRAPAAKPAPRPRIATQKLMRYPWDNSEPRLAARK